jgi:hypothetical protein
LPTGKPQLLRGSAVTRLYVQPAGYSSRLLQLLQQQQQQQQRSGRSGIQRSATAATGPHVNAKGNGWQLYYASGVTYCMAVIEGASTSAAVCHGPLADCPNNTWSHAWPYNVLVMQTDWSTAVGQRCRLANRKE